MRRGVVKLMLLHWQRRETLEILLKFLLTQRYQHLLFLISLYFLTHCHGEFHWNWKSLLNSSPSAPHPTATACRERPDTLLHELSVLAIFSTMWKKIVSVWSQNYVCKCPTQCDMIDKNSLTDYTMKTTARESQCEVKQRMFSLFFHARQRDRGMQGTDESHQHHWEETLKKKVRHTQTLKPQTERVTCLGTDTAFRCCGQCLLLNSVPSCTLTALWHPLWHQYKGAAFNTVLPLWV